MDELYRQLAGITIVLGALAAVLWYARRRGFARLNLGSFGNGGSPRLVKVLERLPLTPQHTLFVLSVGGRTVLLTSSPGSCQLITDLLPDLRPALHEDRIG